MAKKAKVDESSGKNIPLDVRVKGVKAKAKEKIDENIKLMLLRGATFKEIVQELKVGMSRIANISKGLQVDHDAIKQSYKQSLDSKALSIMDEIMGSFTVDELRETKPDKKAWIYGVLHDKVYPQGGQSIQVNVQANVFDKARNQGDI